MFHDRHVFNLVLVSPYRLVCCRDLAADTQGSGFQDRLVPASDLSGIILHKRLHKHLICLPDYLCGCRSGVGAYFPEPAAHLLHSLTFHVRSLSYVYVTGLIHIIPSNCSRTLRRRQLTWRCTAPRIKSDQAGMAQGAIQPVFLQRGRRMKLSWDAKVRSNLVSPPSLDTRVGRAGGGNTTR